MQCPVHHSHPGPTESHSMGTGCGFGQRGGGGGLGEGLGFSFFNSLEGSKVLQGQELLWESLLQLWRLGLRRLCLSLSVQS